MKSGVGLFSGLCLCLAAAQLESSGKQKHYGCQSVSYSGNTVLQLQSNDYKRPVSSVFLLGDISGVLVRLGRQKHDLTSIPVPLFGSLVLL